MSARFEAFHAVNIQVEAFCVVMQYGVVELHAASIFNLQGAITQTTSTGNSCLFFLCFSKEQIYTRFFYLVFI
jgi:hypothetical protein